MSTETPIIRYSPIEAGLATLKEKHLNVVIDVTTKEGMELAKEGRAELRAVRLNLEKARKEEKEDSLIYGRRVDAEAARIKAIIEPMEDAYDVAIKAEENRKEEERQKKLWAAKHAEEERLRLEREEESKRIAAENAKLQAERDRLAAEQAKAEAEFAEKQRVAQVAIDKANAEIKAAQDKVEADARASREQIEAAERESRLRIEAEERKAREIREASDRKEREQKEAAEKLAKEQREKAEAAQRAEQAKKDAAIKAERDRFEADKRAKEVERIKKLDARNLLVTFCDKYGELPEFMSMAEQIQIFLDQSKQGVA